MKCCTVYERRLCESFCGWLLQFKSFLVSFAAFGPRWTWEPPVCRLRGPNRQAEEPDQRSTTLRSSKYACHERQCRGAASSLGRSHRSQAAQYPMKCCTAEAGTEPIQVLGYLASRLQPDETASVWVGHIVFPRGKPRFCRGPRFSWSIASHAKGWWASLGNGPKAVAAARLCVNHVIFIVVNQRSPSN